MMKSKLGINEEVKLLADCLKQVVMVVDRLDNSPVGFKDYWLSQLGGIQIGRAHV